MIGVMLLTQNDVYLSETGRLPSRPKWDKGFLHTLCLGKDLLGSKATMDKMPQTMLNSANKIYVDTLPPGIDWGNIVNLGVETYSRYKPETLLIVRSISDCKGKVFRYTDDYKLYHVTSVGGVRGSIGLKVELWKRNK